MNRVLVAEFLGTLGLVLASLGTGIMAMQLAPDMTALALFVNAFATGLALYVLITIFRPISGAHFNPAVTLYMVLSGQIAQNRAALYCIAQVAGALCAVPLTHAMFGEDLLQIATTDRSAPRLWLSEAVATFGLLFVIVGGMRSARAQVAALAGAWVAAAYWFTASSIFGNPAVTLARMFTDTFTGIKPMDAPGYILAQLGAALLAWLVLPRLFGKD
ncbi:MAG: aquaporin [Paracoccaceae bacterium]